MYILTEVEVGMPFSRKKSCQSCHASYLTFEMSTTGEDEMRGWPRVAERGDSALTSSPITSEYGVD